ncbi:MAG: sigma-70 family RNA polymerase sigma factor [Gemmatimonadetes bacterium]|nr:sigma-70 family RNA polymerase sigma factor [Gemmatimonadota bacterium]
MLDERSAVEQARLGDERAWRELYDAHVDLVFRLAYRVVNDRDAALDVVQEAYVKASRSIDRFRGDSSFRSWIASITLNEARSWARKRARARQVGLDTVAEPADGSRGAAEAVSDADLAARALAFVDTLPDQQREAVLLRTTEGLSYKEIAEMLDTSEGSARVSYHHGITKLRSHMAQLMDAGPTPENGPGRDRATAAGEPVGPDAASER